MALTEREKAILRLKAEGISDYRIARKLKIEAPNVTRSRKNALKKIELAKEDLDFIDKLETRTDRNSVGLKKKVFRDFFQK
jgi:DNA-binding NarL/FixJ family response regulator